jgi:hypothetical protein
MSIRLTACSLLVSCAIAAAIGPGISLVRCLFTGRVDLVCCCADRDASSDAHQLKAPDDCCSFVHLDAAWQSSSVTSQADLPPALFAHQLIAPFPESILSPRLAGRRVGTFDVRVPLYTYAAGSVISYPAILTLGVNFAT